MSNLPTVFRNKSIKRGFNVTWPVPGAKAITAGPSGYKTVYVDGYRVEYELNGVQYRVTVSVENVTEMLTIKCEGRRKQTGSGERWRKASAPTPAEALQLLESKLGIPKRPKQSVIRRIGLRGEAVDNSGVKLQDLLKARYLTKCASAEDISGIMAQLPGLVHSAIAQGYTPEHLMQYMQGCCAVAQAAIERGAGDQAAFAAAAAYPLPAPAVDPETFDPDLDFEALERLYFQHLKPKKKDGKATTGRPFETHQDLAYRRIVEIGSSDRTLTSVQIGQLFDKFASRRQKAKWLSPALEDITANWTREPKDWQFNRPQHGHKGPGKQLQRDYPDIDTLIQQYFHRTEDGSSVAQMAEDLARITKGKGQMQRYELKVSYREFHQEFINYVRTHDLEATKRWKGRLTQPVNGEYLPTFNISYGYFFNAKPDDVGTLNQLRFLCVHHLRQIHLVDAFIKRDTQLHARYPKSLGGDLGEPACKCGRAPIRSAKQLTKLRSCYANECIEQGDQWAGELEPASCVFGKCEKDPTKCGRILQNERIFCEGWRQLYNDEECTISAYVEKPAPKLIEGKKRIKTGLGWVTWSVKKFLQEMDAFYVEGMKGTWSKHRMPIYDVAVRQRSQPPFRLHHFQQKVLRAYQTNLEEAVRGTPDAADTSKTILIYVDFAQSYQSDPKLELGKEFFVKTNTSIMTDVWLVPLDLLTDKYFDTIGHSKAVVKAYCDAKSLPHVAWVPFPVFSSDCSHSRYFILHALKWVLTEEAPKWINFGDGGVKRLAFLSDGTSNQFKSSKFLAAIFTTFLRESACAHINTFSWAIFCAYHGKSAADVEGGNTKYVLRVNELRESTQRMQTPQRVFQVAHKNFSRPKPDLSTNKPRQREHVKFKSKGLGVLARFQTYITSAGEKSPYPLEDPPQERGPGPVPYMDWDGTNTLKTGKNETQQFTKMHEFIVDRSMANYQENSDGSVRTCDVLCRKMPCCYRECRASSFQTCEYTMPGGKYPEQVRATFKYKERDPQEEESQPSLASRAAAACEGPEPAWIAYWNAEDEKAGVRLGRVSGTDEDLSNNLVLHIVDYPADGDGEGLYDDPDSTGTLTFEVGTTVGIVLLGIPTRVESVAASADTTEDAPPKVTMSRHINPEELASWMLKAAKLHAEKPKPKPAAAAAAASASSSSTGESNTNTNRYAHWTEDHVDALRRAHEKHNNIWVAVAQEPGLEPFTNDQCRRKWKQLNRPKQANGRNSTKRKSASTSKSSRTRSRKN